MRGGIASLAAIKIGFDGLSLLTALILARYLGPAQYGILTLTTAWVTILAVIGRVGLDQVCTKVVSKSIEFGDEATFHGIVKFSVFISFAVSSFVGVSVGATAALFVADLALRHALYLGACLLPLMGVLAQLGGIQYGLQHPRKGLLPSATIAPVGFLLLFIFYLQFDPVHPKATSALLTQIGGYAIALLVAVSLLQRDWPKSHPGSPATVYGCEWLRTGIYVMALNGVSILSSNLDIILLGVLSDAPVVGIYKVAARGAELSLIVSIVMTILLSPRIASAQARFDLERVTAMFRSALIYSVVLAIILAIPLAIFAGDVLGLFGEDFRLGSSAMRILAIGRVGTNIAAVVGLMMVMIGREKRALLWSVVGILISGALCFLLIPIYGMLGASIATAGGEAVKAGGLIGETFWVHRQR